jgi:hypothetical protein
MHDAHIRISRFALAAMLVWLTAPALAQTPAEPSTRGDILDAARDALSSQSAPPTRSTIERGLYWYDNQYVLAKIFGGWKGIHIGGGGFPAGAGMKFGVSWDRPLTSNDPDPAIPNRVGITAGAAYSTRGYARVRAGLNARNLGGAKLDIETFGQYYEFPQEDFFGIGMNSQESDRSNYLLDATEAGATIRWRPSVLEFGGGAAYFSPRIGRGTDSRFPSVEDTFAPTTTPGLGTQTDFLKFLGSAAIDWQDNPLHPHSGGRYGVEYTRFDDRDLDAFDFHRVDVKLEQYVPLGNRYRVIALRADGVFTDADQGHDVPFYLQPTLGGAKDLRGFREFRFQDQNSLLLGAEYRWEAWWALDAALFVDAGTVAHARRDLSLGDMEASYGLGLRFHSNRAFVARLDLAFSREGFVPLLRFDHVF